MSLALCAPQSSRFSLSFALRKLFANLGTGTVCGQIFSSECITYTFQRKMHESRIEEGTQLVAFFLYFSPFYLEIWSHRYVIKSQFNKLISPAEQGLIPG